MLITDVWDMDETRDWRELIEAEARHTDRPTNSQIFSNGFY
jgi:hypothetical protein